jgi:hypothetical protein
MDAMNSTARTPQTNQTEQRAQLGEDPVPVRAGTTRTESLGF